MRKNLLLVCMLLVVTAILTVAATHEDVEEFRNFIKLLPFTTTATNQLQFRELASNGTNYFAFKAPTSMSANITAILPTTAGTGALTCTNSSGTETCSFTAIGDITTGAFSVPHVDTMTPVTIADNGGGTAATSTLTTPATSYYEYTCSDTDGCDLTLGETSVTAGQRLTIVNVSSNVLNIADSAGVSETAGAMAMGQYDSISFVYETDRWVETSRSNN